MQTRQQNSQRKMKLLSVNLLIFREESESDLTHDFYFWGEKLEKKNSSTKNIFQESTRIWIPLEKSSTSQSKIVFLGEKFVGALP